MTDETAPPEPISLDDAKLNLRVDDNADDTRIASLIVVAREHVESYTGLVLTPRTLTEAVDRLGSAITLASWPVVSVDAVNYPGPGGDMITLPASAWRLSQARRPAQILPAVHGWGVGFHHRSHDGERRRVQVPVEIELHAGYDTPDAVPAVVKQAMHLLIAHLYSNRRAVETGARAVAIEIPVGVDVLLQRWRLDL